MTTETEQDNTGAEVAPEDTAEEVTCCDICGDDVYADELTYTVDGAACESCAEDYVVCEDADAPVHRDNAVFIEDEGVYYAESYVDSHYTWAIVRPRSGGVRGYAPTYSYIRDGDAVSVDGEMWAREVADNEFHRCTHCDEYVTDPHYDSNDDPYCRHHLPDEEEEEEGLIHNYSKNVLDRLTFSGNPKDKIHYGVELEVEASDGARQEMAEIVAERMDGHALLKEDGSLDYGFEITTRPASIATHRDYFFATIDALADSIRRRKISSYNAGTCGLHVHISRAGLSQLQIGKMQVFLHNPDNAQFIRTIAQRDPTRWATIATAKKITDKGGENSSRYTALNLHPRHTVELRIFRGTLNKGSLAKSLEFTEALVHWTKCGVCSIDTSADHKSFLKWIAEPQRALQWPHLNEYLRKRGYLPELAARSTKRPTKARDAAGKFTTQTDEKEAVLKCA